MRYRRTKTPGATYFFTVVTFARRTILCDPENVVLLRDAFRTVKSRHPFTIDAFVLLPDHLHCIWTLPPGDMDYPTRWMLIKRHFSLHCADIYKSPSNPSRRLKREQSLWQRRYWEHQIRDDGDFEKHCDYIHWNPVKHGLVSRVVEWPHSSFHRFLNLGIYSREWAGGLENRDKTGYGE
jgi:putative transposase